MSFEAFEGFDEWDEKFLDLAIRLEEEVISTRNASQAAASVPPPTRQTVDWNVCFSPPRELSQRPNSVSLPESEWETFNTWNISVPVIGWSGKDNEIERLKKGLSRVSKQLNQLQHECLELKKERDKKDEQLRNAFSQIEAKNVEIDCMKIAHKDYEATIQDHASLQPHGTSTALDKIGSGDYNSPAKGASSIPCVRESVPKYYNHKNLYEDGNMRKDLQVDVAPAASELKRRFIADTATSCNGRPNQELVSPMTTALPKCTKARGIQTDFSENHSDISAKDESSLLNSISKKLHEIWEAPSGNRFRKDLLSKIFVACASDFYELFRCMSSSRINLDSLRDQRFNVTLHEEIQSVESAEAAKVTRLFTLLTEISNGMMPLDNLLEALLNLCVIEKSEVVQRSLHILHVLLKHTLSIGTRSSKRDNVVVTHPHKPISSEDKINNSLLNKIKRFRGIEKVTTGVQSAVEQDQESSGDLFSSRSFDTENVVCENSSSEGLFSPVYLLSVFKMMHRVTIGNNEENIRVEAIMVMNLILMRTNPNSERERFGSVPVFESLSWLLRKEVGFLVQMQALRLLFLLLNCPKLLMIFCDAHKDVHLVEGSDNSKRSSAVLHGTTGGILEGLTECLACKGSGAQELKLRRHAIIVLAFIASSGKCGFEVLLNLSSSEGRMDFLELIVRVLTSEIGAEAVEMVASQELSRERTLLVREALILLNRLASNPVYSTSVLGVLTSSRAMANLTIDVVDSISRKNRDLKYDGSNKIRTKESELVQLANSFRTRLLTFLGDNIP
ncbi:protein SENSITIVE TO UV 2-like [Aristolochia californica]|uniref:protein SENSITIVE TO UV 2-like n=1 Tax=Aristolochia californica TaxID=171875 RepID=UPI0035D98D00